MWRFHVGRKLLALSRKNCRSRHITTLSTSLEKPLHSQANSEKRFSRRSVLYQGLPQACVFQRPKRRKMSDSRQYDFVRRCHNFRPVRYHDFDAEIVKRFLHRSQIARSVIYDGDHRSPLVLGSMRPRRRSREQATRNARAKALKRASILWWLERP